MKSVEEVLSIADPVVRKVEVANLIAREGLARLFECAQLANRHFFNDPDRDYRRQVINAHRRRLKRSAAMVHAAGEGTLDADQLRSELAWFTRQDFDQLSTTLMAANQSFEFRADYIADRGLRDITNTLDEPRFHFTTSG